MEGKAKVLTIIVGIVSLMIPYGMAAFTQWDANPKNWSDGVRWLVCYFGILMCASSAIATYNNLKKDDHEW